MGYTDNTQKEDAAPRNRAKPDNACMRNKS